MLSSKVVQLRCSKKTTTVPSIYQIRDVDPPPALPCPNMHNVQVSRIFRVPMFPFLSKRFQTLLSLVHLPLFLTQQHGMGMHIG